MHMIGSNTVSKTNTEVRPMTCQCLSLLISPGYFSATIGTMLIRFTGVDNTLRLFLKGKDYSLLLGIDIYFRFIPFEKRTQCEKKKQFLFNLIYFPHYHICVR